MAPSRTLEVENLFDSLDLDRRHLRVPQIVDKSDLEQPILHVRLEDSLRRRCGTRFDRLEALKDRFALDHDIKTTQALGLEHQLDEEESHPIAARGHRKG